MQLGQARVAVIHDATRHTWKVLMDYRVTSAPRLACRSCRAVERSESPARQLLGVRAGYSLSLASANRRDGPVMTGGEAGLLPRLAAGSNRSPRNVQPFRPPRRSGSRPRPR